MCRSLFQQCLAESFIIYNDHGSDHRPLDTLSLAALKLPRKRGNLRSCSKSRRLTGCVVVLAFLAAVFEVESRASDPFLGSCTDRVSSEYEER
jgi:hypothetical protein